MASPLETALELGGVLVLDGAMATELERHGADLRGELWSARLLVDQPELISRVHRDYFRAGADVAITASYQASVSGFRKLGLPRAAAEKLIQRSVRIATQARDDFWAEELAAADGPGLSRPRPIVATSIGPYGAVLADGSEYRGHYGVTYADLLRFHRERLAVLVDAGVEILACETIPSRVEAAALVEAIGEWPELTAWVSFSARNGREVSDGTPVADCAAFLDRQDQVVAVGVNCTALAHIPSLIRELNAATTKPIVVYPNSGEVYDARTKGWGGQRSAAKFGTLAQEWQALGARLIGGCCRTTPDDIRSVVEGLKASR